MNGANYHQLNESISECWLYIVIFCLIEWLLQEHMLHVITHFLVIQFFTISSAIVWLLENFPHQMYPELSVVSEKIPASKPPPWLTHHVHQCNASLHTKHYNSLCLTPSGLSVQLRVQDARVSRTWYNLTEKWENKMTLPRIYANKS